MKVLFDWPGINDGATSSNYQTSEIYIKRLLKVVGLCVLFMKKPYIKLVHFKIITFSVKEW